MTRTQKQVRSLFKALLRSPRQAFPPAGGRLDASEKPGVYVIYGPSGHILHVGSTPRGRQGLAQRLKDHLHGASSFVQTHLKGKSARVRRCTFRCLPVRNTKVRAYLEAYAIGSLCPAHIGHGALRDKAEEKPAR